MEYFIYGLADPKTKKIYYIGKTINLKNRLAEHLTPANLKSKTLKNNWIKSLINKGQKPKIILLKITDCKNVDKLEKKYIKKYRKINPRLKNGTLGGTGGDTSNNFINCSNGLTYKTIKEASKKTGISVSSIKMVLDKYLDSIYGLKFFRLKEKRFLKGKKKYIKIQCSNGMVFDGCKEAAEFIKKQHKLKNNLRYIMSNIYACIIGTQGTILGLQFWQQGEKQPKMPDPYRKKMKPIGCSNGKKYKSLTEASKDLGIDFRLISQVLRNKQKTTKGLSFWYLKS